MSARIAATLFAVVLAAGVWVSAGVGALLYVPIFAAATLPGLPIGLALFGRRHPAAWIGGALIGYGLTQLLLWAVITAGLASTAAFCGVWLVVTAASVAIFGTGSGSAALSVPRWSSADVRALFLVLLLVPVLIGITYRNLGRADDQGYRYYRAYFTADFLWHSALASELGKFTQPPRNPYLAPRAMNYYWTYFLLPSTVATLAPEATPALRDVQRVLKTNALLVGVLMFGALLVFVRSGVRAPGPAAAAVVLALVAASAEGLYAVADLWVHDRPMRVLLDTNVDAITAWEFGGLRVDNMPRSLWYTPQHTTSIALALVAMTIAVLGGAAAPFAAILAAGLALGLATTMNPLIGGVCSILYGVCVAADMLLTRRHVVVLLRHAAAALFVAAAVGWSAASRVMDGAGSALDVGFSGFSRNAPLLTLLLSLGPVLVPALPGVLRAHGDLARRSVAIALGGIVVGLFLLYFVRVSEASWVGFRAGQILLVTIPVLLARTLEWTPTAWRTALIALILAVGLPTTLIDTWNAQDIGNRRPGPGFRWTLWTTPDQQDAFAWIQRHTEPDAIVQMEPMVRGREHWTLIPSFAGRRMAAGLPISLLPVPEYPERSALVRQIFASGDATEASALARRLRLDYLYVDQDDVAAYPDGTRQVRRQPVVRTGVRERERADLSRALGSGLSALGSGLRGRLRTQPRAQHGSHGSKAVDRGRALHLLGGHREELHRDLEHLRLAAQQRREQVLIHQLVGQRAGDADRIGRADHAHRRQRVRHVPSVEREVQQAERVRSRVADGAERRAMPVLQPIRLVDVVHRQPPAAPDRVEPPETQMRRQAGDVFAVVHPRRLEQHDVVDRRVRERAAERAIPLGRAAAQLRHGEAARS